MGLVSVVNSAHAPAGSLDPTFAKGGKVTTNSRTTGTGGIVTTNFADGTGGASALVIQSDSKIVTIGRASDFIEVALARYLEQ